MARTSFLFLFLTLAFETQLFAAATVEVTIKTEKVGDAVHWKPDVIEATAGQKLMIHAEHNLEGGFDFHGLFIPELKISEQVNRHQPSKIERTIPVSMKPGDYKIKCQFHEKHVAATLRVKAAAKSGKEG